MKDLSAVSRDELEAAGLSVKEASDMMISLLRSHKATVILDRADPIAALVFRPISGSEVETSFMATEGFFGGRTSPTRFLRRYLDRWLATRPGISIVSTTYSRHKEVARWYRLMGYRHDTAGADANTFRRIG